jgi:hypothetical protein
MCLSLYRALMCLSLYRVLSQRPFPLGPTMPPHADVRFTPHAVSATPPHLKREGASERLFFCAHSVASDEERSFTCPFVDLGSAHLPVPLLISERGAILPVPLSSSPTSPSRPMGSPPLRLISKERGLPNACSFVLIQCRVTRSAHYLSLYRSRNGALFCLSLYRVPGRRQSFGAPVPPRSPLWMGCTEGQAFYRCP